MQSFRYGIESEIVVQNEFRVRLCDIVKTTLQSRMKISVCVEGFKLPFPMSQVT